MELGQLLERPPDLPVRHGLPDLHRAVAGSGSAVLVAPPGSGKTTLVPPALAAGGRRVVVTQPRRIAVRAAARRLAGLLGEPVGATVGYAVAGERRTGPGTVVEFVTAGLLLRRLQADPELAGVGAVVLDEVHERQVATDLLLAMLAEVRQTIREDLTLVAMSATVAAEQVAATMGEQTPVVEVPGALHPVETLWCPPPAGTARLTPTGTSPAMCDHVARTVTRALAEQHGDLLVFLPGAREVDRVVGQLRGSEPAVDVLALHGRLPGEEQDRALQEGPRRRVVVATAVAESSLTVPGVRTVVDAGLSREPRTDVARGLAGLVTRNVSQAAAEQRAGRAGREGPGTVYRCWSAAEHAALAPYPQPEIRTADLTSCLLELAVWGAPGGRGLTMLDPPPQGAAAAAQTELLALGAVDDDGAITPRGRRIAGVGTDPRLSRALLDGGPLVGGRIAAEVVALLAEDVRAPGGDLTAALRQMRRQPTQRWRQQVRRWQQLLGGQSGDGDGDLSLDLAVGTVAALAHPGRVGRRRDRGGDYLMAGGTGARLERGSPLTGATWLAIADAARAPGQPDAVIRSAAPIDADLALEAAAGMLRDEEEVTWRDGRLVARRVAALGAIELTAEQVARPDPSLVAAAIGRGLQREGLDVVPWPARATALRRRLAFLHTALGEPWPDMADEALLADVERWLGPDLARVRRAGDLRRIDTEAALRRLLPWPDAGRLDALAPTTVTVPTGSRLAVDYSDPQRPVLAVRVQEVFGWAAAPPLADGRVPLVLELLSPARRPAAVTADLAAFWQTGYPQVRAELRGRYPKHPWPEDPAAARPTTRTKRAEGRR